jgi:hypothetical protein
MPFALGEGATLRVALADRYDEDFVSTLGAVEDAIGEWHDWTELAAVAAKVLGHGHECVVLKQIHSNADTKLDQAISLAVRMRRKYLGIESKPRSTRRLEGGNRRALRDLSYPQPRSSRHRLTGRDNHGDLAKEPNGDVFRDHSGGSGDAARVPKQIQYNPETGGIKLSKVMPEGMIFPYDFASFLTRVAKTEIHSMF